MQDTRFISILLAVAVPVAAWLGVEYLSYLDRSKTLPQDATPPAMPTSRDKPIPQSGSVATEKPATDATAPSLRQPGLIHKCVTAGAVVYSDQPCAPAAHVKTLQPNIERAGLAPARSYESQLAALEAERDGQARAQAPQPAGPVQVSTSPKEAQCTSLDNAIASVNARLREPHGPQYGDRLNSEKKQLYDRRFSLGC